jgi:hypothetical protein
VRQCRDFGELGELSAKYRRAGRPAPQGGFVDDCPQAAAARPAEDLLALGQQPETALDLGRLALGLELADY